MPTPSEIRSQITDQIIAALDSGTIPWRQPWRVSPNTGRPANIVSNRVYSGINPLLLELHRLKYGFESKWWATYKQWESIGGKVSHRPTNVKPGEWGCHIVFYKPVEKTVTDTTTGEERDNRFSVLRTYCVFNVDQVEGEAVEDFRVIDEPSGVPVPDFDPAERLIKTTGAKIVFGGGRAFYRNPRPEGTWPNHTTGDYIQMPRRERFAGSGAFYETLLHELAHWTQPRLQWDTKAAGRPLTELCAEMAACFLSSELGIPDPETMESHAAYIGGWVAGMRRDPKFIFRAATQASKIADYLLAFVRQVEPQAVADAVADEEAA